MSKQGALTFWRSQTDKSGNKNIQDIMTRKEAGLT